jgi:hypothetical protein
MYWKKDTKQLYLCDATGHYAASGGGSPGGLNTQVQYNDNGVFGGDPNFTWGSDKAGSPVIPKGFVVQSKVDVSDPAFKSFSGTGVNDLTFSGDFYTDANQIVVRIDGVGPDTFSWGFFAGTPQASGVAITGAAQYLAMGLSAKFAATTGHVLNDSWTLTLPDNANLFAWYGLGGSLGSEMNFTTGSLMFFYGFHWIESQYNDTPQPLPLGSINVFASSEIDGPEYDGKQAVTIPVYTQIIKPPVFDSGSAADQGGLYLTGFAANQKAINVLAGQVRFPDIQLGIRTITSNDSATVNDFTIRCDATAGNVTETMLASPPAGAVINIKKIDASANTCIIAGNGHNIDGSASLTISVQNMNKQLQYDATSGTWNVL